MKFLFSFFLLVFTNQLLFSQNIPGMNFVKKLPQEIKDVQGAIIMNIPDESESKLMAESQEIPIYRYEQFATELSNYFAEHTLSIGLVYPVDYYGNDEKSRKAVQEMYEEHDIRYLISYGITYDNGTCFHSLSLTFSKDLEPFNDQLDYAKATYLETITGNNLGEIKKAFTDVCKKSKFDLSAGSTPSDPEILMKEEEIMGEVHKEIPNLREATLYFELDSYRTPIRDDMTKKQKEFAQQMNQYLDQYHKDVTELIQTFPSLDIAIYDPSTDNKTFTQDDYLIRSYVSSKVIRTLSLTAVLSTMGGAGLVPKTDVQIKWYHYYYLKAVESNDLYFEHYGDYEGMESLSNFLNFLQDK